MFRISCATIVAALGLAATSARADLIAYYTFEGNANNVAPGHIGSYNGTLTNGPTLTTGVAGQAYHFDGLDDFIAVSLDINPSTRPQLTMGAWVKSESRTSGQEIISQDNGGFDRSLTIDGRGSSSGAANFALFDGSNVTNSNTYSTDWTFVAAVYDQTAKTAKLYVNGNLTASNLNATLGSGWGTLRIGSNPSFGEYFHGSIDNVFFYDEALNSTAISTLYRNGGPTAVPLPASAVAGAALLPIVAACHLRRRRRSA